MVDRQLQQINLYSTSYLQLQDEFILSEERIQINVIILLL